MYQPIEVIAGHTFSADVAVRGASGNGDFWIQAFVVNDKPKDYADEGLSEANTIGQLNSWLDASLAEYDGMMSAKARTGSNHTAGTMKWKATTTGTVYFALKVGSNKTSFSYSFDDFTLTDLTAIETGIGQVQADEYWRQDSESSSIRSDRAYNMHGQAVDTRQLTPGIYIVTNGKRSHKVMKVH